jgi:HlyD family secretion protein
MRTILFIAAAAAASFAVMLFVAARPDPVRTSPVAGAEAPGLVEVKAGALANALFLDGDLRAVRSRTIFANTSDEVKIVYLPPEGTLVKAGDRLVELDSTTVTDKIKDAEEKIFAAENEIVKTRSTQESALREMTIELSRFWLALEQAKVKGDLPQDLVSRREFQEGQLALDKARTEYDNHVAKIAQKKKEQAAELQVKVIEKEKLEVALRRARANLDAMNVRAPAEGMVIYTDHWNERRKLQVGDMVWGGLPVVRLPDLREMEVAAQVNEVDGPRLRTGQSATVRLDSYPEVQIEGSVKEISQTAIKASWMAKAKIFTVVFSLNKTVTDVMKPGMSAQVIVPLEDTARGLLVPRAALRFVGDTSTVLRAEVDGKHRPLAVHIIGSDASYFAVADNGALKAGDRITSRF